MNPVMTKHEWILSENRISFSKLANREGVHISTVWRWALRGIRGHQLESFSVGIKKFTTHEAYERWLAKINGVEVAAGETPRQRERAIDRAEQRAAELGV